MRGSRTGPGKRVPEPRRATGTSPHEETRPRTASQLRPARCCGVGAGRELGTLSSSADVPMAWHLEPPPTLRSHSPTLSSEAEGPPHPPPPAPPRGTHPGKGAGSGHTCLSRSLSSAPGKQSVTLDALLSSWLREELQAEQPWGEAHLRLKNHSVLRCHLQRNVRQWDELTGELEPELRGLVEQQGLGGQRAPRASCLILETALQQAHPPQTDGHRTGHSHRPQPPFQSVPTAGAGRWAPQAA